MTDVPSLAELEKRGPISNVVEATFENAIRLLRAGVAIELADLVHTPLVEISRGDLASVALDDVLIARALLVANQKQILVGMSPHERNN